MKKQYIIATLLLLVAGLQTTRAQKVIIYRADKTTVELKTSEVDSIVFVPEEPLLACPDNHHPHAIDLGLPSGTKWACCNVGSSTPEGYGGYYAWGETREKSYYSWENYAYYNSSTDYFDYIGSDIAGTGYDVARVRMGAPWRMPSHEQQMELMNNCSRQWTTQNGIGGILVAGSNGGQIFLPAAGYCWGDGPVWEQQGYYWSSSLLSGDGLSAHALYFVSGYWDSFYYRVNGNSVRAVCP